MKKKIKWVVLSVIVLIVGFHLAKMFMFPLEPVAFSKVTQHGQAIGAPHLHKGGMGPFVGNHDQLMRGHHEVFRGPGQRVMGESRMFIGDALSLLLPLAMVVLGWILFKLGKKSQTKKIIGGILLFLGLGALLPKWLMFLGLMGIGYYLYKTRNQQKFNTNSFVDFATIPSQKVDFLDEWEKTINKEDK